MKKSIALSLSAFFAGVLFLAACAGSPAPAAAPAPASGAAELWTEIDHKGRSMRVDVPAWVKPAQQGDLTALKKDPRFEGKTLFAFTGFGPRLQSLQSWVDNFNVRAEVSRQISTVVDATFKGAEDDDSTERQQLQDGVVVTISRTEINGLGREMDWWTMDRRNDTGEETYYYVVVFAISTESLEFQIAEAMGKVLPKTAAGDKLRTSMEEALKRAEFGGVIPVAR